MIASCPQIFTWVQQIRALLPKLFLLPPSKLEIDSLYSQKLDVGATSVCIQITTNTVYKLRRPVLIEWGIRQTKINWHVRIACAQRNRVKLWTACEYLSIPPESISLIVLAVQPNNPAHKLVIKWNQKQHQETPQWLINILDKEPTGDRSNHSGTRLLSEYILALDDIEEVAI